MPEPLEIEEDALRAMIAEGEQLPGLGMGEELDAAWKEWGDGLKTAAAVEGQPRKGRRRAYKGGRLA